MMDERMKIDGARKAFGLDSMLYNIAVVGQSGVGKSTLINGLRHLPNSHPDAAPVGEIETTSRIESYGGHPINPKLVLWDVPGASTQAHPSSTYFGDKKLYAFDCILIVVGERFMQIDFDIAKNAHQNKQPFAFVRAKADVAVKAMAQRMKTPTSQASKELRKRVEESLHKGLKDVGFSTEEISAFPCFIVSSLAFTRDNAYTSCVKCERDSSLGKMDEEQLQVFITNLVRARDKERQGC